MRKNDGYFSARRSEGSHMFVLEMCRERLNVAGHISLCSFLTNFLNEFNGAKKFSIKKKHIHVRVVTSEHL